MSIVLQNTFFYFPSSPVIAKKKNAEKWVVAAMALRKGVCRPRQLKIRKPFFHRSSSRFQAVVSLYDFLPNFGVVIFLSFWIFTVCVSSPFSCFLLNKEVWMTLWISSLFENGTIVPFWVLVPFIQVLLVFGD
jgi:hypothetical protein